MMMPFDVFIFVLVDFTLLYLMVVLHDAFLGV
jgi:hypothetical protein